MRAGQGIQLLLSYAGFFLFKNKIIKLTKRITILGRSHTA